MWSCVVYCILYWQTDSASCPTSGDTKCGSWVKMVTGRQRRKELGSMEKSSWTMAYEKGFSVWRKGEW